jgi:hypothetical protein
MTTAFLRSRYAKSNIIPSDMTLCMDRLLPGVSFMQAQGKTDFCDVHGISRPVPFAPPP